MPCIDLANIDYSKMDKALKFSCCFSPPRPEWQLQNPVPGCHDVTIPVEERVSLEAKLHLSEAGSAILFFHGNGEIAADYNDLGPALSPHGNATSSRSINRGYGRSGGPPPSRL